VRAAERATTSFLAELREGWQEFSTRTWLWVIVIVFAFLNAAHSGTSGVLGPAIARDELGGAAAWGFILAAQAAGLLIGGLLMLRLRVRRILLVGCAVIAFEIPGLALLALGAPTLAIAGAYLLAGIGIEVFSVYWDIALQENVDQEKLSRVYSYDALGSLVLIPLGFVAAGPLAELLGTDATLWLAAGVIGAGVIGMLLVKDVRALERRRAEA
jgi:hypothetical protein